MTLRKSLLAATILALPFAAQAQPVTGLYVAGGAGANWQNGDYNAFTSETLLSSTGVVAGAATRTTSGVDQGWLALGSLGWGFGNGLRVEAEGSYRYNETNRNAWIVASPSTPFPSTAGGGSITTTALMANVFYDLNLRWVMPYVGAGVGYAWHRRNGWLAQSPTGPIATTVDATSDGSFAWQVIAGLAVPIPAVPGLSITGEYRYFSASDMTVNGRITNTGSPAAGSWPFSGKVSNDNQSVLLGVRYNFGRGPAPAPVAAAPAPARSFLVFFDFASDQLTARAREIVGQAAQAARSQQVTRIEVAGHTDTVGSAQYNQGLSIRRANNVAAELVRQGVPRQAITTAGFGFSRPLVPTGPNVREPQNRRVEIVLR